MSLLAMPILCLVLFGTIGLGQAQSTSSISTGRVPKVTMTAKTSIVHKMHCQKKLTCHVVADKTVTQRILKITILENGTQTELKKVASIYHAKIEGSHLDHGSVVESLEQITNRDSSLTVHKLLPPNDGFDGQEYICKVEYLDIPDTKVVVSGPVEETPDSACNIPDLLDRWDNLEQRLNLSVQSLKSQTDLVSKVAALAIQPIRKDILSCEHLVEGLGIPSRFVAQWRDRTPVLCDTETDGGGWTVFQRRYGNMDQTFEHDWDKYENTGIGNIEKEFWMPLRKIQRLLDTGEHELRIDMKFNGSDYYALYSDFKLSPPCSNYTLSIGEYSGSAGDALRDHSGFPFSTRDRDNDGLQDRNCAEERSGGWWYHRCLDANLNGLARSTKYRKGLNWVTLTGESASLTETEMKVRLKNRQKKPW